MKKDFRTTQVLRYFSITFILFFLFFGISAQTSFVLNLETNNLNFCEANRTMITNTGSTSSGIPGTATGSVHRYNNLIVIGAIHLSAYLTIVQVSNADITVFDDDATTPVRFQPRIGTSNSTGGYVLYKLDYFDAVTNLPVFLYNYYITCVDIDGSNSSNREYVEFSDYSSYSLGTTSGLTVTSNSTSGRTQFLGIPKDLAGITFDNTASVIGNYSDQSNSITFALGQTGKNAERQYSVEIGAQGGNFTNPTVVNNPIPLAHDDFGIKVNPVTGGISVPNVLNNDVYNGLPVVPANFTISLVTPATNGGVTLNTTTGAVSVAVGTPSGTYTLVYRITLKSSSTTYDDAKVTLTVNNPPTIAEIVKSGSENTDILFTATDFTGKFSDIDGDVLNKIQVLTLPVNGTLKLSGIPIIVNQEIPVAELANITFTPNAYWNGTTNFNWNGNDGMVFASTASRVTINCTPVNYPPIVADVVKSSIEDVVIPFAATDFIGKFTDVDGDVMSKIKIESLPSNGTLKLSGTAITVNQEIVTTGLSSITFTPNVNWNGITSFNWNGNDGTVYATPNAAVNITVNPVNDAPGFVKGADQTVNEDAGAQIIVTWATALSTGPVNESTQTLNFTLTNNNNALFSVQPSIDPTGKLTYTPAPNANGSAIVSVVLKDDGGITNGGVDTYATQTFNITVNPVNDAPGFVKGADLIIN